MRARLALLVVLGCGDDAGSLPDAPADAAIDAPVDAAAALVTLTITDGGVPAVGATVYFQDADSSLVATVLTGLDGRASAPVAGGGFVTAIEPRPAAFGGIVIRDRLATFAGVQPGDDLHLDLRPPPDLTSITFDVQVPEDPEAMDYTLFTSCGRAPLALAAGTMPTPVTLTGCAGIADVLVTSNDLSARPLRALYRPAQVIADGATLALPGPYTALLPVTIGITSSPAWVASYLLELDVTTVRGPVFPAFAAIDPGAPSAVLELPDAPGTAVSVRADVYLVQPAVAQQSLLAWDLPIGDHTLDAGALALRPFTTAPVFDPATRTVTWTDGAGLAPDVVRAEVYTYRAGDPAYAWHWQLVAPHGSTPSVTFPVLPPAAAAFTTTATDSFSVPALETLAISGGYDRLRPHALGRVLDRALPGASGSLSYQRLYEPNLLGPPTLRPPATFTRAIR